MIPRYLDETVRELIIASYRVVYLYDVAVDLVMVGAILHGSQDIFRVLGDDPWNRA